ncbi:hypothetical protein YE88_22820 [Salmonella enterica subsp. enterica serovar Schwarzengrund]|nr:hypothetical protein [Salmonella enterica subsp. enterica serovar Schwarzengrund]
MSEVILFVFEGEKTEAILTSSLLKFFLSNDNRIIVSSFKTDVYSLFKKLSEDEDLDAFSIIKSKDSSLDKYNRDDFSQMYLFFDYDGHAPGSSNDKIRKLLNFFSEETDKGKLFISYPMIESVKCINDFSNEDCFFDLKYKIDDCTKFKGFVHEYACNTLIDFNQYKNETWNNVINLHCIKSNFIVNEKKTFPIKEINQIDLFEKQFEKHIDTRREISVIGSFPLMLMDYYGLSKIYSMISGEKIVDNTLP